MKVFQTLLVLTIAFYVTATPLVAEDTTAAPSQQEAVIEKDAPAGSALADYSFWTEFFNMTVTLTLIVATLILITWGLKKLMSSRLKQMNSTSEIRILERRTLSPKSSIYLIEVMGHIIVVGETPAGLQRLGEISSDDTADTAAKKSFSEIMQEN